MSGRPSLPGVEAMVADIRRDHAAIREALDGEPGAGSPVDPLELSFEELISPRRRDELDSVVRGIALELDIDYVQALDKLESWRQTVGGQGPVTLQAIIELAPVSLTRLAENVRTLGRRI